jgi:drug/metabolite transporter superfamily protein YnfA
MSIPTILIIVGLLLALVDEFRARGQSLTGWAVVFIAIALLWGRL